MKNVVRLFVIAVTLCLASCGGANTPSAVADKAMGYIQDGKYEAYVDLLYVDADSDPADVERSKGMMASMLQSKFEETKKRNGGIKSYKIVSEEVDEEAGTAVVSVSITYGDDTTGETSMSLKKDGEGNWKIDQKK